MTDIKAVFIGEKMVSDYALDAGALQAENGLETSIVISLFTDRRAEPDDTLPAEATDRRGWWGDVAPPIVNGRPVEGSRIGSRLWLLSREKQLQSVVERARQYCREALAWMIEDGVCERIDVEAEIVRTGVLGVGITIHRPDLNAVSFRYDYAWQGQQQGSAI
ncbi:MAG: phage GP46 family protein [Rhodospirillales bacterium]